MNPAVAMLKSIRRLIRTALEDRVFPGGVLLASREGDVAIHEVFGFANTYEKTPVSPDTLYDLASLTKPLATTPAVMHLVGKSRLHISETLGKLLPGCRGTEKADITVENLLAHRSGMPDYRPYYKTLFNDVGLDRMAALNALLIREPLESPIGRKVVYSDPGFMLLRWVVEHISGSRLNRMVEKEIFEPAGIEDLFYPGLKNPRQGRVYAATEMCPWRKALVQGIVHDENAFVTGGVDGHAGLFGTAAAVHALLFELLSVYAGGPSTGVLSRATVQVFLDYGRGEGRALGFDRPTHPGSSSGRYFSENSVGHLGFTGTSFWMDLDRAVIVILLTNRVHPTRDNERIKRFRPALHDAVMQYLV